MMGGTLAYVLLQTCDLVASDHEHYIAFFIQNIVSLIKSIPLIAFTNKSHQQRKAKYGIVFNQIENIVHF